MLAASDEILDECIACGGSVTGEHGIGVEKIELHAQAVFGGRSGRDGRVRTGVQSRRALSPAKMLPTAGAAAWSSGTRAAARPL